MKRQPKTVKAWAFAVRCYDGTHFFQSVNTSCDKSDAHALKRIWMMRDGYACGPVVRIEVPAPKERKR